MDGGGDQGPIGTLKPFQNLTADLETTASGQMTAEKQMVFYTSSRGAPLKRGRRITMLEY